MGLKKAKIITMILLLISMMGCTILHKISGTSIHTEKNDSIVILGYRITWNPKVKIPEARIYLVNTKTKEEKKIWLTNAGILVNKFGDNSIAMNLKAGEYEFKRWEYSFCRKIEKNAQGKELYCRDHVNLKGTNPKLPHGTFKIKEGEILYLGHILFDVMEATLSLSDMAKSDMKEFYKSYSVDLRGRRIQNITNRIEMYGWKFEMTGYKGLFE